MNFKKTLQKLLVKTPLNEKSFMKQLNQCQEQEIGEFIKLAYDCTKNKSWFKKNHYVINEMSKKITPENAENFDANIHHFPEDFRSPLLAQANSILNSKQDKEPMVKINHLVNGAKMTLNAILTSYETAAHSFANKHNIQVVSITQGNVDEIQDAIKAQLNEAPSNERALITQLYELARDGNETFKTIEYESTHRADLSVITDLCKKMVLDHVETKSSLSELTSNYKDEQTPGMQR